MTNLRKRIYGRRGSVTSGGGPDSNIRQNQSNLHLREEGKNLSTRRREKTLSLKPSSEFYAQHHREKGQAKSPRDESTKREGGGQMSRVIILLRPPLLKKENFFQPKKT